MKRLLISLLIFLLMGMGIWWLQRSSSEVPKSNEPLKISKTQLFLKKLKSISSSNIPSKIFLTELLESEINAFLKHEGEQYFPSGVSQIQVNFQQDIVVCKFLVDFDELRSSLNRPSTPLMTVLFTGKHALKIEIRATTENGTGRYELLSVLLNEQQVPKVFINFLLENYVFPRYPEAKPNTSFDLPFKIKTVCIQLGKVLVEQIP